MGAVCMTIRPSLPGFPVTFWNPYAAGSPETRERWINYLQDASLAKYTADSIGYFVQRTSRDQIAAADAAAREVCGNIQQGVARVGGGLLAVADELRVLQGEQQETNRLLQLTHEFHSETNWQLSEANKLLRAIDQRNGLVLEEARTASLLLRNIAQVLRIPESQKQRQLHIELGLKFLNNGRFDADLYRDSLREFLAAESLMPSDYFVLQRVGMLYLFAPPVVDLPKAVDYFTRAGKYAVVEANRGAARFPTLLPRSLDLDSPEQTNETAASNSRMTVILVSCPHHKRSSIIEALQEIRPYLASAEAMRMVDEGLPRLLLQSVRRGTALEAKRVMERAGAGVEVRDLDAEAEAARNAAEAEEMAILAADSYQNAATAHYALADYPAAVKFAEKSVKLATKVPRHHFYLAKYLAKTGDEAGAAAALSTAVELEPGLLPAAATDLDLAGSKTLTDYLIKASQAHSTVAR